MPGKYLNHETMKFVPKDWGWEQWICNSEKYCGKILFIKQGCSFHYHKLKDEVLFVQSGRIKFKYTELENLQPEQDIYGYNVRELGPGEAWHVQPGLVHQMFALEDTYILEFSTEHFDSDSYRLTKRQV